MPIEISTELPAIIRSVGKIGVTVDMVFRLNPNFGKVTLQEGFRIRFPERITIEKADANAAWRLENNAIVFINNFDVRRNTELRLRITGMDATPENEGKAAGKLEINEKISIEGEVHCDFKEMLEDEELGNETIPGEIAFETVVAFGDKVDMGTVQVKLDMDAALGNESIKDQEIVLGEILPEEISKNDVILDLDNPVIILTIMNDTPLEASLNAKIDAYDAAGSSVLGTPIVLDNKINIMANRTAGNPVPQNIAVSRKAIGSGLKDEFGISDENAIEIPELGTLIRKLPDMISIKDIGITPKEGTDGYVSIDLASIDRTRELGFSCNYEVRTPLAFGEDLYLEYKFEPVTNLNQYFSTPDGEEDNNVKINIKDLYLTFSVENSLPLALHIDVAPIDLDGRILSSDDIEIKIQCDNDANEVLSGRAAGDDTAMQKTEISLQITPKTVEAMKRLDGLDISLSGNAGQAAGVPLNNMQGLMISNAVIRLAGGVELNIE